MKYGGRVVGSMDEGWEGVMVIGEQGWNEGGMEGRDRGREYNKHIAFSVVLI